MSLIDAACDVATRHERKILRVFVRIGEVSGVSPDALRFSFDLAAEGTLADGSALEIENVAGADLQLRALELQEPADADVSLDAPHR